MATQTPNQRTRRVAIDIENTFEGRKSKGLPSRGAGADKGPINPPKNVKTCQNGEKRSTTLAMVHGWASPVHRAAVGD